MWTYEIEEIESHMLETGKENNFKRKGCFLVYVMYDLKEVTCVTLPDFERAVEFLLSHQQYTKHGVIYG